MDHQHAAVCLHGIAPRYRFGHLPKLRQAAAQLGWVFVILFYEIAYQLLKALEHDSIGRVPGYLGDALVEEIHLLRCVLVAGRKHRRQALLQRLQRLRCEVCAGKARTLPLDQDAQLHQVFEQRAVNQRGVIAHDRRQRLGRRVADIIRHECPPARYDAQKAHARHIKYPLIDRASAYPELQSKLALRRQSVPRLQLAREYLRLHDLDKSGLQALAVVCAHLALSSVFVYMIPYFIIHSS